MRLEELKEHYVTWRAMSEALGIGQNQYQYWRKRGYICYSRQLVIEKKTKGLFKASVEDSY